MRNIKKIIIVLIIICIILTIALYLIMKNNNGIMVNEVELPETEKPLWDSEENRFNNMQSRNDWFMVKKLTEDFYLKVSMLVTVNNEQIEELINKLYNVLDKEYIDMFNITEKNLKEKLQKIEPSYVDINKMYVQQVSDNVAVYFVYGSLRNKSNSTIKTMAIGVKLDRTNKTFSILPYEYLEKSGYMNVEKGTYIELEKIQEIQKNKYNTYKYQPVNNEMYLEDIFDTFINRILYNKQEAYDLLNKEYREKRFGNLEKFENYIENKEDVYLSYDLKNLKKFEDFGNMDEYVIYLSSAKTLELKEYNVRKEKTYTQYTCIDNFGNYYIFQETSPFNYTVILDTYTIDLPEFIEKYKQATDQEKVALNINKIIEALNEKDYNYIYNKLDNKFKSNNFSSLDKFTQYMENYFGEKNKASFGEFKNSNGIYTYSVTITGTKTVNKTIIMQLKEGTDFVMSFNV